jgi:enoyl-[acyl-carrier protein] reductase III
VETGALAFFPGRDDMVARFRERTPAGRLVAPTDVAGVVCFLCSPDAAMIRGQAVVVDGGYSLLA